MNKEYLKKNDEELQEYLEFRRRGSKIRAKKGKGSEYKRSEEKNKMIDMYKALDNNEDM